MRIDSLAKATLSNDKSLFALDGLVALSLDVAFNYPIAIFYKGSALAPRTKFRQLLFCLLYILNYLFLLHEKDYRLDVFAFAVCC